MKSTDLGVAADPASAATRAAWDFARIEEFWSKWNPLTPYGKEVREARIVLSDRAAVEKILDYTEAWVTFAASKGGDASLLDRVTWHLSRLPRLPASIEAGKGAKAASLDVVEIFVTKKFIVNYRAILGLIDDEARSAFGLEFEAEELARLLGAGDSAAETFYVADSYDPRLAPIRRGISALDEELARLRSETSEKIRNETGLDFAGRDFLLLSPRAGESSEEGRPLFDLGAAAELLEISPWDGLSHIARPRPSRAEIIAADARVRLLEEERRVEAEVLGRLSEAILAESLRLAAYARAITKLDLARARAVLVGGSGFARPMFSDHVDAPLEIARGRLMPLEGECAAASLVYTPLDLDLPERATIIFGSNMGGKTVVLETVLFLQILAQAGFHVPASRYSTRCYPLIHYVGEGGTLQSTGGLSGFGREIRSLVECSEWSGRGALMAFDEFARSTSSLEAEAILSAALEELAASTGRRSLFSSHFRGIARIGTERIGTVPIGAVSIGTVRHLRMRGLDRKAATSALAAASKPEGLASLAGRINRMMNYELVEDEGGPESSDAILIAGLLGLDPRLVARAEAHYARKRAKDGKRQG